MGHNPFESGSEQSNDRFSESGSDNMRAFAASVWSRENNPGSSWGSSSQGSEPSFLDFGGSDIYGGGSNPGSGSGSGSWDGGSQGSSNSWGGQSSDNFRGDGSGSGSWQHGGHHWGHHRHHHHSQGSGDGGDTPPTGDSGGDSPPSSGSGSDTPPSSGDGGDTPPSTGDGGDTPPITGTGGDTPPITGTGGDTPPTTGGDTPPTTGGTTPPTTGGDTPPVSGGTVPPASGNGFTIDSGKLEYNGKLVNGVAVSGQYAQQIGAQALADKISTELPGINVVRLATSPDGGAFSQGQQISNGESVADIDSVVQALNAKGIGVIVDNHGSDGSTQNNVSQDGNEAAWFAQLAKDNLNNNGVMFQPQNEPTGSSQAIVAEQQAAYQAIRGTGSKAVVAFDLEGGWDPTAIQSDPSAYNADSNYVIDGHAYPGADDSGVLNSSQGLSEAGGGAVPVYIGETGNSMDGQSDGPNWQSYMQQVWSGGTGAVAWLYDWGSWGGAPDAGFDADMMNDGNYNLTPYGQYVQGLLAKGAS